jgi:uncharacterized protein involved in exopolysaccharide biosynthesis/Mrp family chromosome partitioning ATPase
MAFEVATLETGASRRVLPRDVGLIAAAGVGCALLAFAAANAFAPKYLAAAEVSVGSPPARDATDSDFVESQARIAVSRAVLKRVVESENLERDAAFVPAPAGWTGAARAEGLSEDAAARALAAELSARPARRPAALEIAVSDRDPARAAALANAAARAYVAEAAAARASATRQAEADAAGRLEATRAGVAEADKAVEDYKAANGLATALDGPGLEARVKDMNDEIVAERARAADARAAVEQIETARKTGADVAVSAFDPATLGPARARQAEARQQFAAANAELGPRHPRVIDAQARLRAADAAVDAELERAAKGRRAEFANAKAREATLTRQLADLQRQAAPDSKVVIGLRDLERKAAAARQAYELLADQSRDVGRAPKVDAKGAEILTPAEIPMTRKFPPSPPASSGLGLLFGLGLGFLGAARRGRAAAPTRPPANERAAEPPGPPRLIVNAASTTPARARRQSLDHLDLTELGFPALGEDADASEFEEVLDAVGFAPPRPRARRRSRLALAVVGSNETGARTSLAINLAIAASRLDAKVVLLDAAGRNAKLTRAVREAARAPVLDEASIYPTETGPRLALPKAFDPEWGRLRPEAMLRRLLDDADEPADLIICDGPDPGELDAESVFSLVDAIVALEDERAISALEDLDLAPDAVVRLETRERPRRGAVFGFGVDVPQDERSSATRSRGRPPRARDDGHDEAPRRPAAAPAPPAPKKPPRRPWRED